MAINHFKNAKPVPETVRSEVEITEDMDVNLKIAAMLVGNRLSMAVVQGEKYAVVCFRKYTLYDTLEEAKQVCTDIMKNGLHATIFLPSTYTGGAVPSVGNEKWVTFGIEAGESGGEAQS